MIRPGQGWANNMAGQACACCQEMDKPQVFKKEVIFAIKVFVALKILKINGILE